MKRIFEALNVTLRGSRIIISGTAAARSFFGKEKRFGIELPVDVVSVNGKPYFVPRDFFAYGPTEITEGVAVEGGITPSVNYVRLDGGVYVPADYVSESTMKKLEDLDGEYLTFSVMSELQCGENCTDYNDFVTFYKKKFTTVAEQVRLLAEDLMSRGFRFNAKRRGSIVLAEVIGPDGDTGYFATDLDKEKREVTGGMYRGKWALLAETYSIPVTTGIRAAEQDNSVRRIIADSVRRDIRECIAEPKQTGNTVVFVCRGGDDVLVPVPPKTIDNSHKYRVMYKKVARGVNIALSFTRIHNVEVKRDVTEIVTRKGLLRFGRMTRICKLTDHVVDEFPVDNTLNVDVVLIDNEVAAVPRDECGEMRRVKIADPDVKPSVVYTELNTGLYVPVDYVGRDFATELNAAYSKIYQAKRIVGELSKKGFEFVDYTESSRTEITVIGPDGDRGYYRVDNKRGTLCYRGKWSLLGPAYYFSVFWPLRKS